MAQMPSKGAADSIKEKRIKYLISNIQHEISKILSSCIIVEKYPASTLVFNFNIVELDSDLIQSMVNCASVALYKSEIECRCLPTAVTILLNGGERKNTNWV